MPTETTEMLTLAQMQKLPASELRSIALHTPNREYSKALDAMANARDAHALGDSVAMRQYVDAAKRAHLRACEDVAGQCMRVRATAAVIAQTVRS